MNLVDIFFILMLIGALAAGIFQGIIKLMIAIVSLYISIVLASLYFQPLGVVFRNRFRSTLEVGQITAFAVILMVGFIALTVAGLYTFRYAQMPKSLEFLDRIVGTLLGLVLGGLLLGMFALLLRDLFVFQSPASALTYPFMRTFQNSVRGSVMIGLFGNFILPLIYSSVQPILPPEADIIFRI
jgi:membrane protein required for colicin V production